jgi:regulator of protease activity HflC (stomatin/prohibitin superfamily)
MLIVIGIFLILVAAVFLIFSVKQIEQSSVGIVERFGKFHKTLEPGLRFVVPFMDVIRYNKNLRTKVLDSPKQHVITKDNVLLNINTVAYYKITDAVKAVYEIQDVEDAILKIINTTLRDLIGSMELDHTLESREVINKKLSEVLEKVTEAWGARVERVEVKDIEPPADIREAMERQMRAERDKRAQILLAEGDQQSAILRAKGDKDAEILRAEGRAQAIERLAKAEEKQISVVYKALKDVGLDDKIISLEAVKAMQKAAESENKVYIPFESSALMGAAASLKDITNK